MYYAKYLTKKTDFGDEAIPPAVTLDSGHWLHSKVTKVIAFLGGILVVYESGKLIHKTHRHIKKHLKR